MNPNAPPIKPIASAQTATYEVAKNLKVLAQVPYTAEAPGDATNLDHIVGTFGSQAILADDLGVTESTITQWKRRAVPLPWAFTFAHHSGGRLVVTMNRVSERYNPYHLIEMVQ